MKRDVTQFFYPRRKQALADIEKILRALIIGEYAPKTPPISAAATVACVGSCFAEEMAKHLAAQGRKVAPIFLSERWNTSYAVRHFVENALDGTPFPEGFIDTANASGVNLANEGFAQFGAADAYIITFGLAVCWHNVVTHQMVLDISEGHSGHGLLAAVGNHAMRQISVAENVEQIRAIVACIRRRRPTAPIVLTLSPIPLRLAATRDPVIAANIISKATLRCALHEVFQQPGGNVHYWPSYDIVDWLSRYDGPLWGQGEDDLRHLSADTVAAIMRLFSEYYFQGAGDS